MIEISEIRRIASDWNVPDQTVEKDYALGWFLWGIANHEDFHRQLVFRGGTCIKKCYVDTHRYSEDLDFTAFAGFTFDIEDLSSFVQESLRIAGAKSGIDFSIRAPQFAKTEDGHFIHGKVYFRGPRSTPSPISLKLDIGLSEPLIMPPVLRDIGHPYSDSLPESNQIYCYGLEELFAEKLRALGERCRPRDLYDNVYMFRRSDIHAEPSLVFEVLTAKCRAKNVPLPALERLKSNECLNELREHWEHMLGHQLGRLPSFDDYFNELEILFGWLSGDQLPEEELLSISSDEEWAPPLIEWQPGQESKLEPVRFAAVNRLCLDLGYKGTHRLIEPYSLRQTKVGNILLFAIRTDNRELRAYRVDRIQSLTVSRDSFNPVHRIEFTPEGRFSAPLTRRSYGTSHRRRSQRRTRSTSPSLKYVFRCSLCGKQFTRKNFDQILKPHKRKGSKLNCPGTIGLYVKTKWG